MFGVCGCMAGGGIGFWVKPSALRVQGGAALMFQNDVLVLATC